MKKTQSNKVADIRTEYQFDYRKARLNRFAGKSGNTQLVVVLDPDVSRVFTTPKSVNAVLRALIATMPKSSKRKTVIE